MNLVICPGTVNFRFPDDLNNFCVRDLIERYKEEKEYENFGEGYITIGDHICVI